MRSEKRPPEISAAGEASPLEAPASFGDGKVLCHSCRAHLSDISQKHFIQGSGIFKFSNPAGCHFEIALFREVRNSVREGEPQEHYSWFPPCRWTILRCALCALHLGWEFSGPENFFALITGRIRYEN